MSTRIRRSVKKRKQMEVSLDERSDSDDDINSNNYQQPSIKKRKLNPCDSYAKTFRDTLKRTSVLLQNTKQDKFIEIGMNSDNKSYSVIKGALGSNGTKQIKRFKSKKNAWNLAIKSLTDKMRNGYTIVESDYESEEEEIIQSSSSSEDMDIDEGIFNGLSFSMSGALSKPQNIFQQIITNHGGEISNTIDAQHTDFILVKNKNAFIQSKKCIAANKVNIAIIKEQFIHDSIQQNKVIDYKLYLTDHEKDNCQTIDISDTNDENDDDTQLTQVATTAAIPDMEPFETHKESISYNYNYLSSAISLRTTDECIKAELLTVVDEIHEMETELNAMKMQQNTGQILAEIKNVLTPKECFFIIQQSDRLSFQNMSSSKKYDPTVRKSDRLVALDSHLSNIIWDRLHHIIKQDIIETYYVSVVPLGFGVINHANNKWEVSSINNAMRINRYNANYDDFFTYHKDAQYAPSADERSLFTLIIYLNDDFEGGETNFYFNKNEEESMTDSDYTISEEIKHCGGIKEGFECKTIQPSIGDAIIFSPDVIHEGCKVTTCNKYKYILKTDIVVKRRAFDGFAISLEESNDYQRCLDYFMDAQRYELQGNNVKANELYERSLFIRYSYPRKLQQKERKQSVLHISIDNIWLTIFEYCQVREIECVSYLFPELHSVFIQWKMLLNHKHSVEYKHDNNEMRYIPKVVQECGQYHCFEWSDAKFYMEHEHDCCRVAAIYAFYLISHRKDSEYFIAQYNAHSQQVIAVPLLELLHNVFHHRQCNGAYFKIKQESGNTQEDFNRNIDRDYMRTVHGAQFVGGVGLMTDNLFKCDIKASAQQKGRDWGSGELPTNEEFIHWSKVHAITDFMSAPIRMEGCYESSIYEGMQPLEKWLQCKIGANNGDDKSKYLHDLAAIRNGDSGVFGAGKTRILNHNKKEQDYCLCPFRDNAFSFKDDVNVYNHLIFDFSKCRLHVTEEKICHTNSNNMDPDAEDEDKCAKSCVSLKPLVEAYVTEKDRRENIKYYKVNINALLENGGSSISYNHASCQCCIPVTDADISNYFGYSHLKHVHIASVQRHDNKIMMWLSYNNIAAL